MDVLTGLVGIAILINVILAVDLSDRDTIPVRVLLKEQDAPRDGGKRHPVYVICGAAGIEINEKLLAIPQSHEQLKEVSHTISVAVEQAGPTGYVLALIRPDGYKAFAQVRRVVNSLGLGIGYEPVNSDWELVRQ